MCVGSIITRSLIEKEILMLFTVVLHNSRVFEFCRSPPIPFHSIRWHTPAGQRSIFKLGEPLRSHIGECETMRWLSCSGTTMSSVSQPWKPTMSNQVNQGQGSQRTLKAKPLPLYAMWPASSTNNGLAADEMHWAEINRLGNHKTKSVWICVSCAGIVGRLIYKWSLIKNWLYITGLFVNWIIVIAVNRPIRNILWLCCLVLF